MIKFPAKISMSSDKDYLMRVPLAFGCWRPAVSFRFETTLLFAWFRFVSFLCQVLAVRFRFVRFHFFFISASVFRFVSLFQINTTFQLWFRFSKKIEWLLLVTWVTRYLQGKKLSLGLSTFLKILMEWRAWNGAQES